MPDYTVALEKLDAIFINTLAPKCYSCREPLLLSDKVCVKVSVPDQTPLRFHDGYCMEHFTLGVFAFVKRRNNMEIQEGDMIQ